MSCKVELTKSGQINKVLDRMGNESNLYNQIAKIPHVETLEDALEIYKQTYEDKFATVVPISEELGEPEFYEQQLSYKSGETTYSTLKEALETEQDTIQVGINTTEGSFETLIEIPAHRDTRTKTGLVNELVAKNLVEDTKVIKNGQSYFVPSGENFLSKTISRESVKQAVTQNLGRARYSESEFQIQIREEQESLQTPLEKKVMDAALANTGRAPIGRAVNEENLKYNLLTILNDLGVSIASIDQYQKKYKQKNKVNPDATALADIANSVVAFKDGNLKLEDLAEETMHFIVETIPLENLTGLLEQVVETQEYQDHHAEYMKVYEDETLVRKEILGKIMKNISLKKLEGKKESLVTRVITAIREFFSGAKVTNKTITDLSQLNDLVEILIFQKKGPNLTADQINQDALYRLYSLSSKSVADNIDKANLAYISTYNNQASENSVFKSDKAKIKALQDTIESDNDNFTDKDVIGVVANFVESADKIIKVISLSADDLETKGKSPDTTSIAMLNDLERSIKPSLESLRLNVERGDIIFDKNENKKRALDKIDNLTRNIGTLRARFDAGESSAIENVASNIIESSGISESRAKQLKKDIKDVLEGQRKDINYFMQFFGQLHNASNPLLSLLHFKITEMIVNKNNMTRESLGPLLQKIQEKGLTNKDFMKLYDQGFIISEVDINKFEKAIENSEYESYIKVKKVTLSKEDYLAQKEKRILPVLTEIEKGKYEVEKQKRQEEFVERVMKPDYYKKIAERYEALKINPETIANLRRISADRASIMASATNKEGIVVLSEQNKKELLILATSRRSAKNIFNTLGGKKKGIEILPNETEDTVKFRGLNIALGANASLEAKIAFDLHKLDKAFQEDNRDNKKNDQKDLILKTLDTFKEEGYNSQQIADLITSNINVSFTDDFYEGLDGTSFLENPDLINENQDNLEVIEELKLLYAKRASILSVYKDPSEPAEVTDMLKSDQDHIKELGESISLRMRELKRPKGEEQTDDVPRKGVSQANREYYLSLEREGAQMGTQTEVNFANQHLSSSNQSKLREISRQGVNSKFYREGDTILDTQIRFIRANLQPYFMRYAPLGYQSFQEILTEEQKKSDSVPASMRAVLRLFNNEDLKLTAHSSFSRTTDEDGNVLLGEDMNPNYDPNYEGGYLQPKKGKFESQKYKDTFAPDQNGQPTINKDLFEVYQYYLELQRDNHKKMGVSGSQNLYKRIQVSRTDTDKLKNILKGKNSGALLGELLLDKISNRVDDKIYGEKGFQENKKLPKYYLDNLENKEDLSEDFIHAISMQTMRANEYKAKQSVVTDIQAIEDAVLKTNFDEGAKSGKDSQTYKMVKSHIDNSIYGKVENRKAEIKLPWNGKVIDIARTVRLFTKYVSLKNLGFNAIIPITGLITGSINHRLEQYIGDYVNRDSAKLANKEFRNLAGDFTNQAWEINDTSKLYLMGEILGLYGVDEKTRNASYGKLTRVLGKSPMMLHTASNMPLIPRVVLTVLYDNRVIEGKIQNRQQYVEQLGLSKEEKSQREQKWKESEDQAVYNYMNFEKEGFSWDNSIDELLDDSIEDKENYKKNKFTFIVGFAKTKAGEIDGQIDPEMRTTAQRDFLGQLTMLHKGFLSINIQKRLKDRHFSYTTGMLEQGTYRTMGDVVRTFLDYENKGKRIAEVKAMFMPPKEGATEEEILEYKMQLRNGKRLIKEFSLVSTMVLIGSLLAMAADDPDNEDFYMLHATNMLYLRTLNETSSSSSFGMFGDIADTINSPVVAYQSAADLAKVYEFFDGEEIKYGKYKDLSKRQRYLLKATPFKSMYDMSNSQNIQKTVDVYNLHNRRNINLATLGLAGAYDWAINEE